MDRGSRGPVRGCGFTGQFCLKKICWGHGVRGACFGREFQNGCMSTCCCCWPGAAEREPALGAASCCCWSGSRSRSLERRGCTCRGWDGVRRPGGGCGGGGVAGAEAGLSSLSVASRACASGWMFCDGPRHPPLREEPRGRPRGILDLGIKSSLWACTNNGQTITVKFAQTEAKATHVKGTRLTERLRLVVVNWLLKNWMGKWLLFTFLSEDEMVGSHVLILGNRNRGSDFSSETYFC